MHLCVFCVHNVIFKCVFTKTTQSLFRGEVIWSQGKHCILNIWDYCEQEAKKKWTFIEVCPKLSVKNFGSSWNTLAIHLLASWNDHLLAFLLNNVHKKIIMNDDIFVCNIPLALAISLLTSQPKRLLHRKCMGNFWSCLLPSWWLLLKHFLLYHLWDLEGFTMTNFFAVRWSYQKLMIVNSTHPYYSAVHLRKFHRQLIGHK